jgi:hypothetical protein
MRCGLFTRFYTIVNNIVFFIRMRYASEHMSEDGSKNIPVRLTLEQIKQADHWAKEKGTTRSAAMREAMLLGFRIWSRSESRRK